MPLITILIKEVPQLECRPIVPTNAAVNGNLDPTLSKGRQAFGSQLDVASSPTKNRGWMNLLPYLFLAAVNLHRTSLWGMVNLYLIMLIV